jgi:hypothetical protein
MVFVFLPVLEVMTESGGFTLLPGLLAGQQRRMLTVAKCLSVPAVAWLFERTLGRALLPTTLSVRPVLTRAALLVLLGAGVVRLGYLAFQPLKKSLRDQAKSGPMARERSHTGEDYKKVFDAVTTARRRDKSPTPFRVAINWVAELRHAAWGEGFSNRVPVVDYINASANFLNIRPRELSERGFHDWNIRYLITTSGEPPFPKLTKVLQTGRYTLWELDTYDDRFVVAPAGVQIQKLKVGEGRIEFSVAGAPASGVDVTVRSAWYPRWRVRGAGSDLRATPPHPGAKPNQDQILVHVRNGRVKLDCDGMFPRELTGYSLSSLGLFGLVLLARGRRREAALEHVARYAGRLRDLARRQLARLPSRRWIRFVPWGIGLVALGATFALIGRKNLLLPPPHAPGLVVRANAASGRSLGCHREHALGAYVCDEGVQIKSALGSTPVGDDTGEFAELWPAVRVDYGTGKPVIELEFSRVDLKSGTVNLRYEAHGKVHVELAVGDYTSKSRMWWGYGKIGIDVPKSLRPRTLIVRLEPEGPGAVLFQQMP